MNAALANRRILLGITGGIAAYKSAELVRQLVTAGAQVRVAMTPAAQQFITPLTLQALSGRPVHTELLDPAAEAAMGHIELARWAELVLVAPASADFLARHAHGLANDLLSTLCLASRAPLAVAPAMNTGMWEHPATQANLALLRDRGVVLLGPAAGDLACGETGAGRMLEPAELCAALGGLLGGGRLAGLRVLVSAGPTREALDPVRYLSNRSSGRMGYAVAAAAQAAGARVTLVSGPVALPTPAGVERVDVESAAQMHAAVLERAAGCDIYIGTAAVADYRPRAPAAAKIKKSAPALQLELERTEDILAAVAALPGGPFTVGFAAETDNVADYARAKLADKGLDLIAANRVGAGLAFDQEENQLELFWPGGSQALPTARKDLLAQQLIDRIAERYHATPDQAEAARPAAG
ncbi:MAG TPA: bifunctional phosphopantothenoylcysteine decarboxylase/phosphopantothenate--cysteine ligase CoaBC [Gammaproteobacteria bacterium]